jgi:hypothetical protein
MQDLAWGTTALAVEPSLLPGSTFEFVRYDHDKPKYISITGNCLARASSCHVYPYGFASLLLYCST